VLWALGEQSPLAVRGQSMQDVIFGGGRGIQARSAAEVELVLDNSDGTIADGRRARSRSCAATTAPARASTA
jgi:chromosome segregation ATPase